MIANGVAGELFPIFKYNVLLKHFIKCFMSGNIKPLEYKYDYLPDNSSPPVQRARVLEKPLGPENSRRNAYLSSDTDDNTTGYRNFARFLDLAREQNIKVVVAPIPEPEFANFGKFRQGINIKRIDDHVQRIVLQKNMSFIPRAEVAHIEKTDAYFLDESHMSEGGRKEYSKWIAHKIVNLLGREL